MPAEDREKQFERALMRHMRDASPDSSCPDAETLAAYHERTLSLEEMAQWKEHISGCSRCQESLALVEQTENVQAAEWERVDQGVPAEELARSESLRRAAGPRQQEPSLVASPGVVAPPPARRSATRTRLRWMAPIGALAAGVIVWIGVHELRNQNKQEMVSVQVARNRATEPQPSAPSYQIEEKEKRDELSSRTLHAQNAAPKSTPRMKIVPQERIGSGMGAAVSVPSAQAQVDKRKDSAGIAGAIAGGVPPSPAPEAPVLEDNTKKAIEPPLAAGSNAPAAAPENRLRLQAKKAPGPAQSQQANVQSQAVQVQAYDTTAEVATTARNQGELVELASGARSYIAAPGGKHAWRAGDGGKIERTTDAGKTWKTQDSSVTVDLAAGSATSDKVCWIVGKAGTILLTTDGGKHWKQIASPIAEDLAGVQAADALHATIWDASGRNRFETHDGGATWYQIQQ